ARRALAHLVARRASLPQVAEQCRASALHLDRAAVTTIHGFCAEVLRSHPIEAGLPPGFSVDRGPASLRLAREEWEAFLEAELGPDAPREEVWRAALAVLGASELERLGRDLASGAIPDAVLASSYRPVDFAATLGRASAEVVPRLRAALDTRGLTEAPRAWIGEALAVLEPASRGDLAGARRAFESADRLDDPLKARTKNIDKEDGRRVEAIARTALDLVRAIGRIDEDAISAALEAVLPYARRLREQLHASGLVDFDTLLVATRDLLRDHLDVREALKSRFTSILVDEFQDTDPIQYEIVFFLAEIAGGGSRDAWAARLAPGRLFIVGDAKQSIYRFRGADYGAYRRALLRVKAQDGVELSLTANFRSVPGVLGPINDLGRAWRPSEHLPAYEAIEAERPDAAVPAVEIWTTPDGTAAADVRRRSEGRAIAAEIRALHASGVPYGAVLVLMRGFASVSLYLRELREAGIPFVASGGKTFYARPEIVQAIGVLRAVADETDPIARLAYLRSPAGGVPDAELLTGSPTLSSAEQRLAALRAEIATIPVDVAVRHVLERSGLFALNALGFEGAQRVANLEKLAADASEFARDGRLSLLELIDALEERPRGEEEGDSPLADEQTDSVRIMSIHKAKGLEAPVVILADAAAGRNFHPQRDWRVGIDREGGHERLTIEGPGLANTACAIKRVQNRAHDAAEDTRLLYVALTRARERLIVVAGVNRNGPSPWIDALRTWGYDPRSTLSSGDTLHGGTVSFRSIDPPQPSPSIPAGVPAGELDAVERYNVAGRASWAATLIHAPSARATPIATSSTIDADLARAVGSAVHLELAGLAPRAVPEAVAAEARAILARFAASPLSKRLAALEVIGREIPILHRDEGGVLWRGSLDLLAREPDGTLVVIDYKTDAELEGAKLRHRDQLSIYVEALRGAMPSSSCRAELWMLRHDEIVPL
ncbi:MAG TPA: UvrD-helicase domain-containing protein, partial [Candidatus Polarisedimenticolaceae bacterium]|nr:UvrD-helicase domain-containing protein [Candidatus Polarisedimenticolaceae bacterium]